MAEMELKRRMTCQFGDIVPGVISLNDAILAGITGGRSKAEDHSSAAQELAKICNELGIEETQGVRHFSALLSRKSDIAYGDQRIDDNDVKIRN